MVVFWFGSWLPHKRLEGIFHVGRRDQRALKFIWEFWLLQVFSFFLMTPPRHVTWTFLQLRCCHVWVLFVCLRNRRVSLSGGCVLGAVCYLNLFYGHQLLTSSECHQEVWRVTHQLWKCRQLKSVQRHVPACLWRIDDLRHDRTKQMKLQA